MLVMVGITMANLLPATDIAVPIEPSVFLEKMAEIGRESSRFDVEDKRDSAGGPDLEIINFRFREDNPHEGLGFQLIARQNVPNRVSVEVRARRWSPDPPTRLVYCEAAKFLVGEMIKVYNKTHKTRLRLRIDTIGRHNFKMTKRTTTLLDRFTVLANTSSLHPLDWQRFYALVKEGRQEIPEHVIRSKLLESGFTREKVEYLSDLYQRLWEFKRIQ